MQARLATTDDVSEVLRLAALMLESIGSQVDPEWSAAAEDHFRSRLGDDVAVFVVDNPEDHNGLVAVAAGSVHHRLPVPGRPQGATGFVQWVSTDDRYRHRGASRSVMEALMSWFEERNVEVVELHATPPAEPLYRFLGFKEPAGLNMRWTRTRPAG